MSPSATLSQNTAGAPRVAQVDMKLEVVVIPVADVDRAKQFYGSLGWRLYAAVERGPS
jgi:bleomycin resistance family protein